MSDADKNVLEASLSQHVFLTGDVPSSRDAQVFEGLSAQVPCGTTHPYLYAWYALVSLFSAKVKEQWPTPSQPAASQEVEDTEADPFTDDPRTEAGEKQASKATEMGKLKVVFEIKPVSFSVNLDEVAQVVMTLVACEDLKWCDDFEKVPVAYGLFKLRISCMIAESVNLDEVTHEIMAIKDRMEEDEPPKSKEPATISVGSLVASVDIVQFFKT